MMYGGGRKGLTFVLMSAHALFYLATATTCTSPITVIAYTTFPNPTAYNSSSTTGPLCEVHRDTLSCSRGASLLFDNVTGDSELDTSQVLAWDREVSIAFTIQSSKVRQVNLFFYNISSSGIGLPPAELFWSNSKPLNPDIPLSHDIVGNQDLSQDDRTLRNVSLVVTTNQSSIDDYRFFRIHFTFPAEPSLIDWILLSEVQLCGGVGPTAMPGSGPTGVTGASTTMSSETTGREERTTTLTVIPTGVTAMTSETIGSTTTPRHTLSLTPGEQLSDGVIAAAVIIGLIFIGVLVVGVIVLVVVFLRWHKKAATKSDLKTQNGSNPTNLTAMVARKHTADDIEWQTEPQLYSAVHKKTPPAIPAQNFDITELKNTLYDDTVLKHSEEMTKDIQTEQESNGYEHAPNQLDIYAEPLQGRRLTPNATFRSSEPIYNEPLDPTLLFTQDTGVSGKDDLHPYGAIYADPQPLKQSEAPIEITASNIHEINRLGFGEFGEVVLAETVGVSLKDMKLSYDNDNKNIHIQVAVKKLKPDAQLSVREAFGKEIKFMSRLRDENIVCLLAICTSGSPFIVMEYMENGDLNQYLQKYELATSDSSTILPNQLPSSILVYMVVQIASGMRYLASLKYVHRDMATRNCLVGQGYMVKIADFGMSRSLYEDSYYRVQGKAMLPIRWMATESFYGRFSEKTDVWAYGVTMWEVFSLCKQQPYQELADQEVIQNAIKGRGRQLLPKPEGCSQEIYEMMLRCWEHIPDERADFEEIFSTLYSLQMHM